MQYDNFMHNIYIYLTLGTVSYLRQEEINKILCKYCAMIIRDQSIWGFGIHRESWNHPLHVLRDDCSMLLKLDYWNCSEILINVMSHSLNSMFRKVGSNSSTTLNNQKSGISVWKAEPRIIREVSVGKAPKTLPRWYHLDDSCMAWKFNLVHASALTSPGDTDSLCLTHKRLMTSTYKEKQESWMLAWQTHSLPSCRKTPHSSQVITCTFLVSKELHNDLMLQRWTNPRRLHQTIWILSDWTMLKTSVPNGLSLFFFVLTLTQEQTC